jgi:hypothetical protein
MNIKELKNNAELAVKLIINDMVQENATVSTNYNIEQGIMSVVIQLLNKDDNNNESLVTYQVQYREEGQTIAIGAAVRHYIRDAYGLATVSNEMIFIDENFISTMKQGIQIAMENSAAIIEASKQKEAENDTVQSDANAADDIIDGNAE